MKIKDSTLRQIIREEYSRLINEEDEKSLTRKEALAGIVSDNGGLGSTSGQGAGILASMVKSGKADKSVVKSLVKVYKLTVSPAQKKALGI
tara:strand:+ start:217 stop:489 length:273 start_codon:yes stop_codon:yes gene_type:complete